MSSLVKVEHNVETGEIVEIPLTEQEIAELEKMQLEQNKNNLEQMKVMQEIQAAKAIAHKKLEALGLTVEDLKALSM